MFGGAAELIVRGLEVGDLLLRLGVGAVIDVGADRDPLRQLLQAANVVDVVVGRDQVVDLLDPRIAEHRHDAREVALAGIAAVDEERLAGRRHEQRRLAALGVRDVDVERLALRRGRRLRPHPCRHHDHQRHNCDHPFHTETSIWGQTGVGSGSGRGQVGVRSGSDPTVSVSVPCRPQVSARK
jgi:hypothetical protein